MAINDVNMLPPHVLQMEQMRDLIQAEQQVVTAIQEKIEHIQMNLYLHSSTDTLARLEHIYGLPTNTNISIDERQRKLIVKHNVRAPCTPQYLADISSLITTYPCTAMELPAQGAFSISVPITDTGSTMALLDLYNCIAEIRPAHLLFFILALFDGACANTEIVSVSSIRYSFSIRNIWACYHALDGIQLLDGSWLLNQVPWQWKAIPRICFSFGLIHQYTQCLHHTIIASIHNDDCAIVPCVSFHISTVTRYLDGHFLLDGSWLLDQDSPDCNSFTCSSIVITAYTHNQNTSTLHLGGKIV